MRLNDWLKISDFSVKAFAEEVKVERAMVYRYFTGAIPRAQTIRRIEQLTNGAVTAQDFYNNAMQGTAMQGTAMQSTAMQASAMQASVTQDNVMQNTVLHGSGALQGTGESLRPD